MSVTHGVVYAIRNALTGRASVGNSIQLDARWRAHRKALDSGNHSIVSLQRDWKDLGSDGFEWLILEAAPSIYCLRPIEQRWLNRFSSGAGVYNRTPSVWNPNSSRICWDPVAA